MERAAARCYWVSLGELSKLIEICKSEGITADHDGRAGEACEDLLFDPARLAAGQSCSAALPHKNTDSLIGGVAKVLADEGIKLVDSTLLLKPLLAPAGAITKRKPDSDEQRDIEYGRKIAHALASLDLGQSVAIADRACVALEAMEGTDAMLRRAASLVEGKRLTLVKASSRRRHLLFDVPVIGPRTIDVMIETNTTALAVDAGRTLLLDREELLAKANAAKIAIVGMEPPMRKLTRVAVIGAGSFGKNHVRVVRENPRAELTFVVDSDLARARELAGDSVTATADYRDVIGQVDAAILAVPTVRHAEIGCALLEAGIDVLVEKPIAPTLAEADRLVAGSRAQQSHSAGRPSGTLQSRRHRSGARCDPAAVFRNPPHERLHAAQPGRGCGARSDDPRSRYRACAGAARN